MKAHIKNQQATIDGQVFEAPGIEDGWEEVELVPVHKKKDGKWYRHDENDADYLSEFGYAFGQIIVKQEGEDPETISDKLQDLLERPFRHRVGTPKLYMEGQLIEAYDLGRNSPSSQQSKRIAELEGALREVEKEVGEDYYAQCDEASWYNNNMPNVGQSLDYKPLPPMPKALAIITKALKGHPLTGDK